SDPVVARSRGKQDSSATIVKTPQSARPYSHPIPKRQQSRLRDRPSKRPPDVQAGKHKPLKRTECHRVRSRLACFATKSAQSGDPLRCRTSEAIVAKRTCTAVTCYTRAVLGLGSAR